MLSIGCVISRIFMDCTGVEVFTFESNHYEAAVSHDISEGGKIQSCVTNEQVNWPTFSPGRI